MEKIIADLSSYKPQWQAAGTTPKLDSEKSGTSGVRTRAEGQGTTQSLSAEVLWESVSSVLAILPAAWQNSG